MKIGIMGGTFDPIHNGHLMLGEYAYKQYHLDQIWFMPNGTPPHKANHTIGSQAHHRVNMVKLAIADTPYFSLQSYEVDNVETNYSYKTMEHFLEVYPEHTFYFIIGADSLFSIEKWVRPDRLLKTCTILAAFRDDKDTQEMMEQISYLNQKYNSDIRLLNTPNVDISSSDIRKKLKAGISVEAEIPASVNQYIFENRLFKDENDE